MAGLDWADIIDDELGAPPSDSDKIVYDLKPATPPPPPRALTPVKRSPCPEPKPVPAEKKTDGFRKVIRPRKVQAKPKKDLPQVSSPFAATTTTRQWSKVTTTESSHGATTHFSMGMVHVERSFHLCDKCKTEPGTLNFTEAHVNEQDKENPYRLPVGRYCQDCVNPALPVCFKAGCSQRRQMKKPESKSRRKAEEEDTPKVAWPYQAYCPACLKAHYEKKIARAV